MDIEYTKLLENVAVFIQENKRRLTTNHVGEWIQLLHIVKGWLVIHMQIMLTKSPEHANKTFWFWVSFYAWTLIESTNNNKFSPIANIVYQAFRLLLLHFENDEDVRLPFLKKEDALEMYRNASTQLDLDVDRMRQYSGMGTERLIGNLLAHTIA